MSKSSFQKHYSLLNPEQKKAVDTIDGPVMIIAGPGTGKTQILTLRIANILQKTDISPQNILALTFTESGSKAMRERLSEIIGTTAYYVNINTFHAFCNEIIKEFPEKFLLSEKFDALSDLERIQIFRQIIDENSFSLIKPLHSKYYYVPKLITKIQELKREAILPEDFQKIIISEEKKLKQMEKINPKTNKPYSAYISFEKNITKHKDLLLVYQEYQKKLLSLGRYDYEDMINVVLNRLVTDEDFRLTLQERYHYVLVDEYQDTNTSQNKLVKTLADYWDNPNVFVVGDDEQSIYRFQGASLENILFFRNLYPECEVIALKSNYRSTQILLDGSRSIIENNQVKIDNVFSDVIKKLFSVNKAKGHPIQIYKFNHGDVENYFLGKEISSLIAKGTNPSEIAILVRNNYDVKDIIPALDFFKVPYYIEGGEDILENGDINRLINLIKVVENPMDDILLFTVLNYEFLKLDTLDIVKSANLASKKGLGLFTLLSDNKLRSELVLNDDEKLFKFFDNLLKWKRDGYNSTLVGIFEILIKESGFIDWILKNKNDLYRLTKLNNLFTEVKKLNYSSNTLTIKDLIDNIELLKENNIKLNDTGITPAKEGIRIMTAHKAKGLEFEYVFIVKAVDKKWGNNSSRELIPMPDNILSNQITPGNQIEDERRLFYVSITRAKKKVYITYSAKYSILTSERFSLPSVFINELSDEFKEKQDTSQLEIEYSMNLHKLLLPKLESTQITLDEHEFISGLLEKFKLSPTALNTYLECRYKFKLNNLFRVPKSKSPSQCYGTAVHKALQVFFSKYKLTKKLPDKNLLLNEFEKALKKEILAPKDFSHFLITGKQTLDEFYEKGKTDFKIPLYLEYSFGYRKVLLGDIALTGMIDKIEFIDKERKTVNIIDYKTSSRKSKNEIEGKTKNSKGDLKRQLLFYKLLSKLDINFNFNVEQGELIFIKKGKIKTQSISYSTKEVDELKKIIKDVMENIRNFKFNKTSKYSDCKNCQFNSHCWPDGIPSK